MRRRLEVAIALAAVALGLPATASADALLTFEDLAAGSFPHLEQVDLPGDPVGSERGIEWGVRTDVPDGSVLHAPVVGVASGFVAPSGTHVLEATNISCGGPRRPTGAARLPVLPLRCGRFLTGRFPLAKQHVRLHVGLLPPTLPTTDNRVTARLLDVSGEQLSSDSVLLEPGGDYVLELAAVARLGVFLTVEGQEALDVPFWVDDVSFDAPVDPPPPDFGLTLGDGTDPLPATLVGSQLVTIPVRVNRANRSAGAVRLSISGLPPRVAATFVPALLQGRTGTSSVLRLRSFGAVDVPLAPVSVTATPADATAGPAARRRGIGLAVEQLKYYDARVTGMEITQGTQYPDIPTPDPDDPARPVAYRGVQLVAGRRTVVRVFANNARAVPVGGLGAFMLLHGYGKDGRELPGSPLSPVSSPRSIPSNGGAVITDEIRRSNDQAFTFVLPDVGSGGSGRGVWPANAVRLRAELIGPGDTPSFVARSLFECGDPGCRANNAFTVDAISWATLPIVDVYPVALQGVQPAPPDTATVFAGSRKLLPMTIRVPFWYQAVLSDVGIDYANRDAAELTMLMILDDATDTLGVVGILPVLVERVTPGKAYTPYYYFKPSGPRRLQPMAAVNGSGVRPLSAVAHELAHTLGRPHAGPDCKGSRPTDPYPGEDWPPDQRGYLNGYGLDVDAVSSGAVPRVIASTPTEPVTDIMSYCNPYAGDPSVWISPRGWDEIVTRYRTGAFPLAARPTGPVARVLHVGAVADGPRSAIGYVREGLAGGLGGSPSGYRAVARDAGGAVLAQTVLSGGPIVDGGPGTLLLRGDLPLVGGIARVELVAPGGATAASLARSAHAPAVRITAPAAGARVRTGKALVVRWAATDADGDPLRATVDLSVDDGRTWRPVALAPSTGALTLAPRLLEGSRTARVRVRVRDALDETAAVSARFRIDGNAPTARIVLPRGGATVRADAVLPVRGEAADDGGRWLAGRSLRWLANGRPVGRGDSALLSGLPAGRVVLRLVARDRKGREGSATVRLRVVAVRPILVRFAAPKTLARRAGRLPLVVAANVAARLSVRGQRFRVGPRTTAISVRVPRGTAPLRLALRLRAAGKTSTATLTIPRS